MPMLSILVCIHPDEASYSITAPPATSSSSELSTASQHSYFPFNRSQLSSGGATAGDPSASFDYPFYHQSPNESQLPAPAEYLFTERESSFAALDHDWEHDHGDRQTSSYLVDGAQGTSVDIEERPKDGVMRSTLPPTILWTLPEDTGLSLLDHQDFSPYDTPEPTWTHPAPSPQGSTRRKVLSSRISTSQRPFFGQNTNFLDRTSRSHETRSRNTDKGKRRPSPNYSDAQVQTEPVPPTVPMEKLRRAEEKCESLWRSIRRLEKDLTDARTESSRTFSCRSFWSWSRDSGDANLQVSAFPDLHFAHLGR